MAANRPQKLMSLAAALAALAGTTAIVPDSAEAKATDSTGFNPEDASKAVDRVPNRFVGAGDDLLGFIVSAAADGTEIADHYSHVSHASHSSHASHASHYSGG